MKKLSPLKKLLIKLLIAIVLLIGLTLLLNVKVTTLQGVDYQVQTIKIPLYLKMLSFMDRHYNYKQLVRRIIENEPDEKEKVMKIFSWTYHNIKMQPESLPVLDDHVWHIIIRGYGVDDQSCDVFATLCNYAGIDAFFDSFSPKDKGGKKIPLSFIKLNNRWHIFDPFNGVYFVNTKGGLADFNEIKGGDYRLEYLGVPKKVVSDYKSYFDNIPDIKEVGLKREKIQSPLKRLLYELRK